MNMTNLTARETHFDFGKNWEQFATGLTNESVEQAVEGLRKLCPDLVGRSFLDIGSGSGLSAVAALELGASRVVALDIDQNSVSTSRAVLSRFAPHGPWEVAQRSVFDLKPSDGQFDVVHSWGVLHHTGAMWKAIEKAAAMVAPSGELVLAIYAKTPMCRFWKVEKAVYRKSPELLQKAVRTLYVGLFSAHMMAKGINPIQYRSDRRKARGMDFSTDAHDWLGGYPYESASPQEIRIHLQKLGFSIASEILLPRRTIGLFGSGCDQYVARRVSAE
jgi:2-polyprenyl-6-hydroxyphenyl methylase/3-demethylubiquinone-9 3-methyltransferase